MGVNCCDICKAFKYCMEQPDSVGIDDFDRHYYDRAACRFATEDEYFDHITKLGGEGE